MIWAVCFALGLVLIAIAANMLFAKRYGRLRYALASVALAIAAAVLCFPRFAHKHNLLSALLSCIHNVMQIISLDADLAAIRETVAEQISSVLLEELYGCLLAIVHIALPTVMVVTAYNILAYCMAHAKLGMTRFTNEDIFIFSCCTKKAELLAKDINDKNSRKSTCIFGGKMDDSAIDPNILNNMNCIFYYEDITSINLKLKKKRKIYYFNMSDNDEENLNNTLALIKKYANSAFQRNVNILVFLTNNEDDILIDAASKGNINIRIIDEDQASCYDLLDKKPLYTAIKNNTISLLITGFDNCGEELLKAAIWCGQLEGISLKINIVTDNIKSKKAKLLFKYPEILCSDYNISFHEARLDEASLSELLKQHCMDTTYIAVTNDSDEENLKLAIYLRRFFLRNDSNFQNTPFIAAKIRSIEKYEVIKNIATPEFNEERKAGYDIYPFGNDKDIYSYRELVASPLEKLAQNIHLVYEDIFNTNDEIDVSAALARYNVFEVKKRSNRANAMHIRYKLWLMGLDYTNDDYGEEVKLSDYLDNERMLFVAFVAAATTCFWVPFDKQYLEYFEFKTLMSAVLNGQKALIFAKEDKVMSSNFKTCIRGLAILLLLSSLPIAGINASAAGKTAVITKTSADFISGYYIEYTFNGNTYRSDEAGAAANRTAFRLMSEKDRNTVYKVMGTKPRIISQFGDDGYKEIMQWAGESNEWSVAKKIWLQKITKREFSHLADFYGSSLAELCPRINEKATYEVGKDKALYDKLDALKTEIGELFAAGKVIYTKLGKLKGKKIAFGWNVFAYEVIGAISDSVSGGATKGIKPISELIGTTCKEAGKKILESKVGPESTEDQIAKVEDIMAQFEQLATTIKNVEIPRVYGEICSLLDRIETDKEKVEREQAQKNQENSDKVSEEHTKSGTIVSEEREAGENAIKETRSNEGLINSVVPQIKGWNGENRDEYLAYCDWLEGQIINKMGLISADYEAIKESLYEIQSQFETARAAALAAADPALENFGAYAGQYVSKIFLRYNPHAHEVNGSVINIEMLKKKSVDAVADFSSGTSGLSGGQLMFSYELYRDYLFDDEIAKYLILVQKYNFAKAKLEEMFADKEHILSEAARLYGKVAELENKIYELRSLYIGRVVNYPHSHFFPGKSGAEVNTFFGPITPDRGEATAQGILALINQLKADYNSAKSVKFECEHSAEKYGKAATDLALIKSEYCAALNDCIEQRAELINEYFETKGKLEGTLQTMAEHSSAAMNFSHPYFRENLALSSYTYYYDGKPVMPGFQALNFTVAFQIVDDAISAAPDRVQKRQEILSEFKEIQEEEIEHTTIFDGLDLTKTFYETEINRLCKLLNLPGSSAKSLAHISGKSESDFETLSAIRIRISEQNPKSNLGVKTLCTSNVSHAIEMLENRTEFFYLLERYEYLFENAENEQEKENIAKNINEERWKVDAVVPKYITSITYAREGASSRTILSMKAQNLGNLVARSGVNYTGAPAAFVSMSDPVVSEDLISVDILNMLKTPLKNSKIMFATYDRKGKLIESEISDVTNIEHLYSENRCFTFTKPFVKCKAFLWDKTMKPLVDASVKD